MLSRTIGRRGYLSSKQASCIYSSLDVRCEFRRYASRSSSHMTTVFTINLSHSSSTHRHCVGKSEHILTLSLLPLTRFLVLSLRNSILAHTTAWMPSNTLSYASGPFKYPFVLQDQAQPQIPTFQLLYLH